jgi:phenylacetate-CoA ligase
VLNGPVYSWYGSNEMNGFLAGTLPNTQQYIFNPLIAYVEITDDDGNPVRPGVVGHLILTHLSNYAFPFIRYDTGDRAAIAPDQNAGGFVVIERLGGRSSERVRFPSGKALSAITLGNRIVVAPGFAPYIRQFQCALIGDNTLELRVVWSETPPQNVIEEMIDSLRMHTDPDTVIHVKTVEALGTFSSGKRWIIRDERL